MYSVMSDNNIERGMIMKKLIGAILACLLLTAACAVTVSAGDIAGLTPVEIAMANTAPTIDGRFDPDEGWGDPIRSVSGYDECVKYCYDAGDLSADDYAKWIKDPAHVPSSVDVYVRWDDTYLYYCCVEELATRNVSWKESDCWRSDGIIVSCTLDTKSDDDRTRWNMNLLDGGVQNIWTWEDPYNLGCDNIEFCVGRDESSKTTVYEFAARWSRLLSKFTPAIGSEFSFRDMLIPSTADDKVGDPVDFVIASTNGKYYWRMTLADAPIIEVEDDEEEEAAAEVGDAAPAAVSARTADPAAALAVVCILAAGAVVVAKKKF